MTVRILVGDCSERLHEFAADSIHACVTDPPYELGFMGKAWDASGVAFSAETWREVLRVLKPGAHLLAFSGTRTYHRMACAIEDAGFQIRDQIGWLYGSGFPKSLNLSGDWEGWGTALKPAWEPVVLARKPFKGPVVGNVAKHGTGALNIDGCRINPGEAVPGGGNGRASIPNGYGSGITKDAGTRPIVEPHSLGRWPANVVHDGSDEVVARFPLSDGQNGEVGPQHGPKDSINTYGDWGPRDTTPPRGDTGSAARFFYCAKADKADRNDGCDQIPPKQYSHDGRVTPIENAYRRNSSNSSNSHPTVKPTDLMRWLCRLVTPKGGTVLDPFMGSGSTGRGAFLEGLDFIGIEQDPHYAEIARARIKAIAPLLYAEVA